jgi:uncharacterized membrane protein
MPMMIGGGWVWIFPLVGMMMMGTVGVIVFTQVINGHRRDASKTPPPDPLDLARERYAQGLISKSEFEKLVGDLVRTEHPNTLT